MDQRIINLYDEYTHKPLPRDQFLKKLVMLTGSLAAAMAILPRLEANYSALPAASIPQDLFTERISYATEGGEMKGYIARPKEEGRYPAVVIIHENRGLNPHIEDVTRRAAQAGYLALAPDALSLLGGTPANEDEARGMFGKLDSKQNTLNFARAFDYLPSRKDCTGAMGCVGFCWGGAMANQLAIHAPALKAAVAFYGMQPAPEDVPKIKAAVQLHYAGLDQRVNAGKEAYVAALEANHIPHEVYVYEGVNHAFHNNTSTARYDAAAAKLAWQRTLDFWKRYVK